MGIILTESITKEKIYTVSADDHSFNFSTHSKRSSYQTSESRCTESNTNMFLSSFLYVVSRLSLIISLSLFHVRNSGSFHIFVIRGYFIHMYACVFIYIYIYIYIYVCVCVCVCVYCGRSMP